MIAAVLNPMVQFDAKMFRRNLISPKGRPEDLNNVSEAFLSAYKLKA